MKVDLDHFEIIPLGTIVDGTFLPNHDYPSPDSERMKPENYIDRAVDLPAISGSWAIRLFRRVEGTPSCAIE
jgi:hypothetical protein